MDKKILVVDDDKMNLMRAKMILSKEGYEVVTVDSGEEALKAIAEETFALLLLDIEMPELGGIETLKRMRETKQGKNLPVMFMTGTYEEEQQKVGRCLGVLDCVKKPFLPPVILEQVGNIISR